MRIEQRLAEQIHSFHLGSLSSAVALNVDLDTTRSVWAAAYDHPPDTIWRRFINTSGQITIEPHQPGHLPFGYSASVAGNRVPGTTEPG